MVTVAAICEAFSECSCQASCCNYSWRCETTKWRGFQDIPVKGDRCSWIFSSRCFPVLLPKVPMCRSWQKCRWFREFWMPLSHFQSLSRSCFVLPASKPKPNPRVDIASWWLQQMVLGCFRAILCCFRGMETRTLARLECETVKQLHPDKCFCFRFRRHLLGGIFFACATRSDDVWHDTLELQHVVPIPENVPTFLYGKKVLRASPFKMGWRVSVSCPDRDSWDGSILPCCIHSCKCLPKTPKVGCKLQMLFLVCGNNAVDWPVSSDSKQLDMGAMYVYMRVCFFVPSEAWSIWPFTSYKVKQNDHYHYHPINDEVAPTIFRRHEKLQNTTQQEWNYILYLRIVFPFVSNTLNLRKKTCFLVDL